MLTSHYYQFRSIFKVFAESQGLPLADLVFTYNGRVLGPEDNARTAGFSSEQLHRIVVSRANVDTVAIEALVAMSKVVVRPVTPGAVNPGAKTSDLRNLFRFDGMRLLQQMVLYWVGMGEVMSCALVSRVWLTVSCKHAVAWQLNQGSKVETDMPRYTELLKQAFEQAHGTMHPSARAATVNFLSLHKNKWKDLRHDHFPVHLGGYLGKGALCGLSAILRERSGSFQSQLNDIVQHRMQFFELLKAKQELLRANKEKAGGVMFPDNAKKTQMQTTAFAPPHDASAAFKIVPAVTPTQKQETIALYRNYFGSDLHFMYPVVVGAATVGDLFDFSDCVTWIVQDGNNCDPDDGKKGVSEGEANKSSKSSKRVHLMAAKRLDTLCRQNSADRAQMHAAITWRMHYRAGKAVLAEVLFMATWPERRGNGGYG